MNITKKDASYFIRITGVLLIITMAVAFLLSFVNAITKDVIAENEAEKTTSAIKALFPSAASPVSEKIEIEATKDLDELNTVKDGQTIVGYYAKVSPTGFKGDITMLVGMDTQGKITGVQILSMTETPGIGDKILEQGFLSLFVGQNGSLTYKKGATAPGEIDGISGATYSSKAVIVGANAALEAYAKYVSGV